MIKTSNHFEFKPLICALCHNDINEDSNVYQSMVCFAVICDNCHEKFSEEAIDLMINMFLAYGGYFSQFKKEGFSIEESIKKIIDNLKLSKNFTEIQEYNIRLLHQALLYGISPQEYVEKLKEFNF